MCGRYNVSDNPLARELMQALGLKVWPEPRRNVGPGSQGQFVIQREGSRELVDGLWSLLIQPKSNGHGYRPDPDFTTFNARSDGLATKPLWRRRYFSKRCIVPADGFHEWRKSDGQCFQVTQQGQELALGGLYEMWEFGDTVVPAFAIITLPRHPRFAHIHNKSIPLMLESTDFDAWLDPDFHDVEAFTDLLQPRLRRPLLVTPIESPKTLLPAGPVEVLLAD